MPSWQQNTRSIAIMPKDNNCTDRRTTRLITLFTIPLHVCNGKLHLYRWLCNDKLPF